MSLLDLLGNQLDDQAIAQIGSQLGVDSGTASKAIGAALPMLVSALAKNASNDTGAQALGNALQAHDGNILGDLAGFLGGGCWPRPATTSGGAPAPIGSKSSRRAAFRCRVR